jgi:hypothetical protein
MEDKLIKVSNLDRLAALVLCLAAGLCFSELTLYWYQSAYHKVLEQEVTPYLLALTGAITPYLLILTTPKWHYMFKMPILLLLLSAISAVLQTLVYVHFLSFN